MFEFNATGYGRVAAGSDKGFAVAQTGGTVGPVAGRAVLALQAGDWDDFRRLFRRSPNLRVSVTRHHFEGDYTEVAVGLSYGHAALGAIRLPADAGDRWIGMSVTDALALAGLEM